MENSRRMSLRAFSSSSSSSSASSTFASSTASSFASRTSYCSANATSRGRTIGDQNQCSSCLRFSLGRSVSPNRSFAVRRGTSTEKSVASQRRTCLCSPTTHPGSFRCSYHKGLTSKCSDSDNTEACKSSSSLSFRRSAMVNSVVRIGGVEGDLTKRALKTLIRPSSHQQRRRTTFQVRPSRLSAMSMADADYDRIT